jgi:hypothetical protein
MESGGGGLCGRWWSAWSTDRGLTRSSVSSLFLDERGDLCGVVGEHAPPAPGACTVDSVDARAVPSPGVLEVRDAPSDPVRHLTSLQSAATTGALALGVGAALSRDDDGLHPQGGQLIIDFGLAVSTVGGDGLRDLATQLDHATDGGGEERRVGWVADHDLVVEHDAIGVVERLGLFCRAPRNAALDTQAMRTT